MRYTQNPDMMPDRRAVQFAAITRSGTASRAAPQHPLPTLTSVSHGYAKNGFMTTAPNQRRKSASLRNPPFKHSEPASMSKA
jgi:hypothetical protein